MSPTIRDVDQEILVLEPSLLSWAHVLTRDPREADVLVRETLVVARRGDEGPRDAESVRIWLHRLLRRRFHSVERDRNFRRSRSNPISAVGYARERVTLTEIAPGTAAAG